MRAYLDHAATTPLCASARAAMEPWLGPRFGNPSGSHGQARAAGQAVDEARDLVAAVLGARPGDVVFTSGGTEAANLAVFGRAAAHPGAVVVGAAEHHCVLQAAAAAARYLGAEVRTAPVGADGTVDLDAMRGLLDGDVAVVSVQAVNNETGVVQPLAEVAEMVRRRARGAVLHADAVQAVPWFDIKTLAAGADLVSISAHKFGGPQGVGALAFRRDVTVAPTVFGGPQERERRAGTHNVAGIVGLAAALASASTEGPAAAPGVAALRDRLREGLLSALTGAAETAPGVPKTPGHCHLVVEDVESEALLVLLDGAGVAASAGAACASGAMEPSHVLLAMGYPPDLALGALRLTLGPSTIPTEVDLALEAVPRAVAQLRGAAGGRAQLRGAALEAVR